MTTEEFNALSADEQAKVESEGVKVVSERELNKIEGLSWIRIMYL